MEHLQSMYIDDELSLNEKGQFITLIHQDSGYYQDTQALLTQEQHLAAALRQTAPAPARAPRRKPWYGWRLLPFPGQVAVAVMATLFGLVLGNYLPGLSDRETGEPTPVYHRFVLHEADANQVEIVGSFTHWKKIPLLQSGSDGYWEITMQLPVGEHRYSFVVGGHRHLPDPTVQAKETDDFGSANSILRITI
jgi:hypothetical protein